MALGDYLRDGSHLALDTDAIIYYVEEHPDFIGVVAPAFEMIARGAISGHVSAVSLTEVLVRPIRNGHDLLAQRYRSILTRGRNLTLHPVSANIADRAARLRAELNLAAPDAMIAATALETGCSHFLTNDGKYRSVQGLQVLLIREHAP